MVQLLEGLTQEVESEIQKAADTYQEQAAIVFHDGMGKISDLLISQRGLGASGVVVVGFFDPFLGRCVFASFYFGFASSS